MFKTEEEKIETAETAGRNVAWFEIKNGHKKPRSSWVDYSDVNSACSHLAAVGFSRLGARVHLITFIDAYKKTFEDLTDD